MTFEIPGYEILEQVGEGGMAKVYRARHMRLDRIVAIKVLLKRYALDPSFADRFLREARISAKLNHPNIVQIYDVDKQNDTLYLTMEYVGGGDLLNCIRTAPRNEESLAIVSQLAAALDYAHNNGYIHRDIKPANILFRGDGSIAVSDFGIAKAMNSDTQMTQTGLVVGTPSYMSPEQAQGHELSGRSDLYSLAVIVYQLILGQLPFQADSSISMAIKHISEPIPTLPVNLNTLQPFFDRALAKDPNDRFANGATMIDALKHVVQNFEDNNEIETTVAMQAADETVLATRMQKNNQAPNSSTTNTSTVSPISKLTHDTIHLVFMQFNKFFFFVRHPDHKLRTLVLILVALNLTGFGVYFYGKQADKKELSPAEVAELGRWVARAQNQVEAGNLIGENENNALASYHKILTLSPNDPFAERGINQIHEQLVARATKQLNENNISAAEQTLAQLRLVKGGDDAHELIVSAIEDKKVEKLKVLNKAFGKADAELKAGRVRTAIDMLSALKTDSVATSVVNEKLETIAEDLKHQAEEKDKNGDHTSAIAMLNDAQYAARATQDNALKNTLVNAGAAVQKKLNATISRLVNNTSDAIKENSFRDVGKRITQLKVLGAPESQIEGLQNELKHAERELEEKSATRRKIISLYKKGYTYTEAGRPRRGERVYRTIAKLSPEDPGLNALGQAIADAYVPFAEKEIAKKDWEDVDVWVQRGLKYSPNHVQLLKLSAHSKAQQSKR